MKTYNKPSIYSKLNEIKSTGVDVSKYISETASSDAVPYGVIVFINKHIPIEQLYTYNKIHERRHNNPLYKNLVNENLSVPDRAIALSSFMTQTLIHMKELGESEIEEYASLMNINRVSEALQKYSSGDSSLLNEVFLEIRQVFKELYS